MTVAAKDKEDLLSWVNDQVEIDVVTKFILYRLGMLADGECCAWAKVSLLAKAVNKSERTVQYHLRLLEEIGLIERTGRSHRLKDSTRSVPIYQLAPQVEGLGAPRSMGAEIAPIDAHGCNPAGGMGAIGLHPQELIGTDVGADAPTASARAAGWFEDFAAAMPEKSRKFTKWPLARTLWAGVVGRYGAERLIAAAKAFAADPDVAKQNHLSPIHTWLADEGFVVFLPRAGGAERSQACEGGTHEVRRFPDADLRAAVLAAKGETFVASYLDPAQFDPEAGAILPRTNTAFRELRYLPAIKVTGLRVIDPLQVPAVALPEPAPEPVPTQQTLLPLGAD